jgi:FixJ family two-component response regulator
MESQPMSLLLVDDDAIFLRSLARMIGRPSLRAGSLTEARSLFAAHGATLTGCLVDVGLPEGSRAGLDFVDSIHASKLPIPCVLLTGSHDLSIVGAGARRGTLVIRKEILSDALAWILQRIDRATPAALVRTARARWGLSEREEEIVAWFLAGRRVTSFLSHSGITRSTFNVHRRSILAKTGAAALPALATRLFSEALGV